MATQAAVTWSFKYNLKPFLFPHFLVCAALFIHLKSLFVAHFKLCKLSFVQSECSCVQVPVCVCVCVCVHARIAYMCEYAQVCSCEYALRFVSTGKILCFINTLCVCVCMHAGVYDYECVQADRSREMCPLSVFSYSVNLCMCIHVYFTIISRICERTKNISTIKSAYPFHR